MYCQFPLTNILQNTTSSSNFSIKLAKIFRISRWIQLRQPADIFSYFIRWNICVYSVSEWELVTGHMLYISQSACQKVLAANERVVPSFGRFYFFFAKSSLLFQDFKAFCPPKCTFSLYQDQGMDRQDIRLPEVSSSRAQKSRTSRKYLRETSYKPDPTD